MFEITELPVPAKVTNLGGGHGVIALPDAHARQDEILKEMELTFGPPKAKFDDVYYIDGVKQPPQMEERAYVDPDGGPDVIVQMTMQGSRWTGIYVRNEDWWTQLRRSVGRLFR